VNSNGNAADVRSKSTKVKAMCVSGNWYSKTLLCGEFFFFKDPIYLQSVIILSANGGKGKGWHVEEYSVALQC
jgi:hypothetical protein